MDKTLDFLKTLCAKRDPSGTIVTLALDLSKSGRLPEATRVFLKDQVYANLASEARPAAAHDILRKLSRRMRAFVESEVRPETDGLFLVAGPGLWEAVELRRPLRNLVTVGRSPYVAPLLEADRRAPTAYVVNLNAKGGRIEEHVLGEARRVVPVPAPRLADDVEKAAAPRGGAERDLRQRRLLEAAKGVAREAAARLSALDREAAAEAVFLPRPSPAFVEQLPPPLRRRTSVLEGQGVVAALEARYEAKVAEEVEAFRGARERGLRAALGPRDVLEALESGRVERVFLDPDDPRLGLVCAGCGAGFPELRRRCAYCDGDLEPASLTQEVVARSLRRGGPDVTFVKGTTPWLRELDGMAALLKTSGKLLTR